MSRIFDHERLLDIGGKTIAWSFGARGKLFIKPENGVVNVYISGWNEDTNSADPFAIKMFSSPTVWKAARYCRYVFTGKNKLRF